MKNDLEKRFEAILEEEKSESKIYTKPFLVGVLFVIAFFIASNLISFIISYNEFQKNGIIFGDVKYNYTWGFPFEVCTDRGDLIGYGLVLNTFIIAFFSFFFGFLFRFIWSKISHLFVKVK